jgi:hypothetical protein
MWRKLLKKIAWEALRWGIKTLSVLETEHIQPTTPSPRKPRTRKYYQH